MTDTHWLALLCLLVEWFVILMFWKWIHAQREATAAARELTAELRKLRDTFPPDEEMVA